MHEALLDTARQAARAAGAEALKQLQAGISARDKGFRQWVTDGDLAAQEAALEVIRSRHPDHTVVAEEGNPTEEVPAEVVWFVDPVDGTTNYARQIPFFNVSIGAAIDGHPVAGAIYDPLRDQMFSAAQGGGATLDGQPIRVREVATLAEAIIAFDSPPDPQPRARQWAIVHGISTHCRSLRAIGSAALGMAYVAAGWLDAYLHVDIETWDVAASAVMVEEAGGVVRRADGSEWQLGARDVVMASSGVMSGILDVISSIEG